MGGSPSLREMEGEGVVVVVRRRKEGRLMKMWRHVVVVGMLRQMKGVIHMSGWEVIQMKRRVAAA